MGLTTGQSLTHYEILGPLGAGAMGEVYRARDTRLEREVALKVLPEELAGDEERLRRFEREAKTLASLNHPNVAQVFGIDQVDDTCFMAMELVPGEDLAARLSRGALPLDETIEVCRQIAEGLEAAHETGVIHRDLKPANVVITPEGKVKVLDFGLAKPIDSDGGASSTTDSVLTTEAGRLLGTPTYMAPEQARGKPIDKRVDVWAFGCVLFECLTGRRAFEGETLGDVLSSVLEKEPDMSTLPAATPGRLRELLERCLCKDVRRRLRDLGDARILLEDLATGTLPDSLQLAARVRGQRLLVPLLAATTVVAVCFAIWSTGSRDTDEVPIVKTVNSLTNSPVWTVSPSWSPRGEFIAYSEMTTEGLDIFVKPSSGGVPDLRASTPGDDVAPRISPDGSTLAFISSAEPGCPVYLVGVQGDRRTRRVVETGLPILNVTGLLECLGDRPWSPDGQSLLVSIVDPNGRMAVHRVELASGAVEQLSFPEAGHDDRAASLSFDGARIVFHREGADGSSLWTMSAQGGATALLHGDDAESYCPAWRPGDDRVVFRRSTRGGYYDLWELNTETRNLRRITFETRRVWSLSVSADDRIAYSSSDHDTFLHSVSRTGDAAPQLVNAHTGDNFGARPSPNGERIAYHSNREGDPELWLLDTRGGPESRLTKAPSAELYPDWSPDGDQLAFVSDAEGQYQVHVLDIESGTRRLLVDKPLSIHGSNIINASIFARWSPDAEDPRIAFIVSSELGHALWTVRPDGSELQRVLEDVYGFDWYLDSRRGLITRQRDDGQTDLLAVHLESGDTRLLVTLPHTELAVAPDGTAVSFCSGPGHLSMDLHVLELDAPADAQGLPAASGEPARRTDGEGRWHAHNGGWFPDSQTLVFTRDEDYGDVFELIESRSP